MAASEPVPVRAWQEGAKRSRLAELAEWIVWADRCRCFEGGESMFFRQLATKESTLSYFFGCGGKGKSVAVDVVTGDEAWFIEEARKANVSIDYVIDTHVHADHYSGGRQLAQMTGAQYCLHESDTGLVKFEFVPLHDGQLLDVGNVEVRVLHTPGHTPDSVCLMVSDKRRGVSSLAIRCLSVRSDAPICWGGNARWRHSSTTASTPNC
jgi:glyoxylase-like metal-dependent hydrolase (beta-lactamase superfamily II)